MLKICRSLNDLDFERLCRVYGYDGDNSSSQRSELYDYLREDFFRRKDSFYAIWVQNDEYVSTLRMEPFEDGILLESLQTRSCDRRKGYAKELLFAVLNCGVVSEMIPVYAHIYKSNHASMSLHRACGFQPHLDYARFIDGTVSANACTVRFIK